jgi:hypothetical protein
MGTPRQRSGEELTAPRWRRYVAIGDSSTEGLDDPDGSGGFPRLGRPARGLIAVHQGGLEYANLAIRAGTPPRSRPNRCRWRWAWGPTWSASWPG